MKRRFFWIWALLFVTATSLVSCRHKKIEIKNITQKLWFLRTYDRWDTDSHDREIPESRRSWTYYGNEGYENWFFYFFEDNSGYQYHTLEGDTTVYAFNYIYYPEGDSLNIVFQTTTDSVENYHAIIDELTENNFTFTNPYCPHQYEQLHLVNVTASKSANPHVNPKKISKKPAGALIQLK